MYDVIIIAGDLRGLSAALYTTRSNLATLIIGRKDSRLLKADKVDNYFGFADTVSGRHLLAEGEKQAERLGAKITEAEVISIEKDDYFKVLTTVGEYLGKAVLLATGQPGRL